MKTAGKSARPSKPAAAHPRTTSKPKKVATILRSVERMTADAANRSLREAEAAVQLVQQALASLGKNWSRKELEEKLTAIGGHLTRIVVAQEFQDLAGQSLRKTAKALAGVAVVVESGGPTEEQRLSQNDVDSLLGELMP